MTKVFVYGSLMTGRRYHQYYLQGKTFLGKGFLNEYKRYVLGGLDGMVPEKGERVQGEVYEIDTAALAKLDFLHNIGTMFTRGIVDVELENGETLQAEAYIWNR
ncbi:MAG TPA: gamma-glutamylcyclotransferase family protein [Syntrophomonadaceae bacterium]|nr:gamma-glutamylcyclotransferase family protein [Syntrophomonadaceae bacterium]